ncbi:MAG: GIY-YIG nuclease family protein [Desulfovibrio sp.]|jgi:putative endonuclease|nr:GIY-YIG nuclease family protein [Desulfovibrio sp.]
MNTEWHVYLLECADGTFYCGVSNDVERRVDQHNGKLPGGAKYTHPRRPVKLMASCRCESKSAAYSLEHRVKSKARSKKLATLQAYVAVFDSIAVRRTQT